MHGNDSAAETSPARPSRRTEPWDDMPSEAVYRAAPWLAPFAILTDRILLVEPDPLRQLWISVLRASWLNALWTDRRQGQPLTGRHDADKERIERSAAREDAISFWGNCSTHPRSERTSRKSLNRN